MSDLSNVIKEVYVEPIRSVLVVDDEFISLDKMVTLCDELQGENSEVAKDHLITDYPNGLDLKRARKMISSFRGEGRNWLCDIHDGKNIKSGETDDTIANHLHQSDLLILDYNLTSDHNDGTQALSLIKKISENTHFNLIVIYTKSDIQQTFHEVLHSLFKPIPSLEKIINEEMELNLGLWESEDASIEIELSGLFDSTNFLEAVNAYINKNDLKSISFFSKLSDLYEQKPEDVELSISDLFHLGLTQKYHMVKRQFLSSQRLKNEAFIDTGINWIKNERLFVTIVDKETTEPDQLPNKLLLALKSWNPKPLRLLMSKIRTELDGHGISFEDSILSNEYVLAGWLEEFVDSSDAESKWVARKSIQQSMLSLSESLQDKMESFSSNLKNELSKSNPKDLIKHYHNMNIKELDTKVTISKHVNAHVCSKDITGNQLKTGHLLKVENEYFICLTPACDLVPSQSNDWKERLGELMPIKLIKLIHEKELSSDKARRSVLQNLNSNNHIVINIDDAPTTLSYVKSAKDNPQWEQAFVDNKGKISWVEQECNKDQASVNIVRLGKKPTEKGDGTKLPYSIENTTIVGELRYEYALNFLHKFGVSQSRVGLDFIELSL